MTGTTYIHLTFYKRKNKKENKEKQMEREQHVESFELWCPKQIRSVASSEGCVNYILKKDTRYEIRRL